MKRALPWLLQAALLLAIGVLLLNLGERDTYTGGSPFPPEGSNVPEDEKTFRTIVPDVFAHPCSVCGECAHPLVPVQNRRVMTLQDHDGWYKLFWAGDETYFFEDFSLFAACLMNRTARAPRGTWDLRVEPGPATHGGGAAHECGALPRAISVRYELFVSESPIHDPSRASAGPVPLPDTVFWFTRYYDRPHLPSFLHFGWRRAGEPEIPMGRCPCGKP